MHHVVMFSRGNPFLIVIQVHNLIGVLVKKVFYGEYFIECMFLSGDRSGKNTSELFTHAATVQIVHFHIPVSHLSNISFLF